MKGRLNKMLACLFAGILTATAADYSVFAAQDSIYTYYVCPNSKLLREDETDYSEMVEMANFYSQQQQTSVNLLK